MTDPLNVTEDVDAVPAEDLGAFLAFMRARVNTDPAAEISADTDELIAAMVVALAGDADWPHLVARVTGLASLADRTIAHHYVQFLRLQLSSLA